MYEKEGMDGGDIYHNLNIYVKMSRLIDHDSYFQLLSLHSHTFVNHVEDGLCFVISSAWPPFSLTSPSIRRPNSIR